MTRYYYEYIIIAYGALYCSESEVAIDKLIVKIEILRDENVTLQKKLLLIEDSHSLPSLQTFKPRPATDPSKREILD